ncbi:hypothetical protein EJ082_01585 [Brevundimonas diminuta]|jgi:hypothetical protein|uniref:surface-adhesin E family protein n=2 Tax=Brevundimonas TaxID=41275 RepID=UPI00168B22E8|nr:MULTISPECIES: surface-adhesin E family protein [Brevundimonas]MBD3571668.1 hypothetical protein [Brevundimonas diminuta]
MRLVGGFAGAALLAFGTAASAQNGYQPPWPASADDAMEWQVEHIDAIPAALVWSDGRIVAAMERETLKRSGNIVRAWFRWDALNAETAEEISGRSLLVLREMDCEGGRARPLAMTVYAGNNLTGSSQSAENPHAEWIYDRPGQLGEAQTAAACEGVFLFNDADVRRWIKEMSGR